MQCERSCEEGVAIVRRRMDTCGSKQADLHCVPDARQFTIGILKG